MENIYTNSKEFVANLNYHINKLDDIEKLVNSYNKEIEPYGYKIIIVYDGKNGLLKKCELISFDTNL